MIKYLLIVLLFCAAPCAAGIITPPLNIDGNGNVPQQYWNGTEWKTCTGTVSITNSDGDTFNVYIRGYNTAGAPVNALFNQAGSDINPSTRYGLVTNSRLAYYDDVLGTWVRMRGDTTYGIDADIRRIGDSNAVVIQDKDGHTWHVDNISGAGITLDLPHEKIHDGESYMSNYSKDVGSNDTVSFLIRTNGVVYCHFLYEITVEAEADFTIWEASDTTASGTAIVAYNRNRNDTNSLHTRTYHTPTVSAMGTPIRFYYLGAGKTVGGGENSTQEIIFKQNTNYLITVYNNTTGSNRITIRANWYELAMN